MLVKGLSLRQNQTTLSFNHNNVLNSTPTTIQFQAPSMLTNTSLWQLRDRDRLLCDIALRIRQSLDLNTMLQTTVDEVRQFLHTDRVVIFRFHPDWTGTVEVESVGSDWLSIRSTTIDEPCFVEGYIEPFRHGLVTAKANVYTAGLTPCHLELLTKFQVKANLVVPILQGEHLWGLLAAHHCSQPRQWQTIEIDLLKQLATHVSIAIQQAELYQQLQTELEERKAAEQTIREQAALLDFCKDAIVVYDLEHRIVFWNQGAERLYGWKATDVRGKYAAYLLYKVGDCQLQLEPIQAVLLQQGEWEGELYQITQDGKNIVVESHWTLITDEALNPKSILVVNTDVTEKKQLEAQFLRAQRLESLGTLASGIAHDLNNILTPILATAQLLPLKFPGADPKQQQWFQILETSAKRGADLVKQVLLFARGMEGKRTDLEVKHLLAEIRQVVKQTFPKSIDISLDLEPNLWTVNADVTQLHQVLMNLTINARFGNATRGNPRSHCSKYNDL
ncbi:multi-sensor hybrid histidine kinase [Calothrix sp. NIES-4071]|nr:multi-sensor hybrid histidine kinase [Calothrix sp. NIES-4071]BAZ56176.1 multi-sensor hybrid histidine kinase [Calothrix sp. NIES-4105]